MSVKKEIKQPTETILCFWFSPQGVMFQFSFFFLGMKEDEHSLPMGKM